MSENPEELAANGAPILSICILDIRSIKCEVKKHFQNATLNLR